MAHTELHRQPATNRPSVSAGWIPCLEYENRIDQSVGDQGASASNQGIVNEPHLDVYAEPRGESWHVVADDGSRGLGMMVVAMMMTGGQAPLNECR